MRFLGRLFAIVFPPPSVGVRGERAAERHLKRQGYRILGRNIRTRVGEIDIAAESPDGKCVVVVEVKAATVKHRPATFQPEVHVNRAKERKLAQVAAVVAKRKGWTNRAIRFDVIGVELPDKGEPVIRHHVAAFESYF